MGDIIDRDENSLLSPLIDRPSTNTNQAKRGLRPISKHGKAPKFPMFCILLTVMLERLAYYSLLGNLVVYVNGVLEWSPSNTVILTLTFTGITWISCFVGGVLGDVYFGRFNTIIIGLICYFIGFLCLPFITFVTTSESDNDTPYGQKPYIIIWFCFSLFFISLGEGCFKANMSPFGADQLVQSNDNHMQTFFSCFYWVINIGSFIGFGPMIFLQMRTNFQIGYGTSAGCLLLAILVFIFPTTKRYYLAPKTHNVVSRTFQIIKQAWKNREKNQNQRYKLNRRPTEYEGSGCFEDFVPIKHWLDRAMTKYGGSHLDVEVEEVKILLNIIPVFAFLIVYCILYFQTTGTFLLQGMHMDVNVGHMQIPAAWLGLFNNVTILIFVPIFDRVLYPGLDKLGIKVPYVLRMMIGMVLASFALLAAGLVEVKRQTIHITANNTINGKTVIATKMSILYQIPQFMLIGISEIFVLMTGLEFAYCKAPRKMQAIVTGIFFIANGIGSMLGSLLVEIGNLAPKFTFMSQTSEQGKIIPNLRGQLQYFFFGLAVLNLVNLLFFALFCWKRRERGSNEKNQETVDQYIKSSRDKKSKYNRTQSEQV